MSFKVTTYKKATQEAFSKAENVALIGMGEHMTDALSSNTHRQSGLLRNSYNYRTPSKQGPFGDEPMINPVNHQNQQSELQAF